MGVRRVKDLRPVISVTRGLHLILVCTSIPFHPPAVTMTLSITIKTLQQKQFKVDAEPTETVAQLKEKIEQANGSAVAQQKLIYSGKILADDKVLGDLNIKEKDFLVLMVAKVCLISPSPFCRVRASCCVVRLRGAHPAQSHSRRLDLHYWPFDSIDIDLCPSWPTACRPGPSCARSGTTGARNSTTTDRGCLRCACCRQRSSSIWRRQCLRDRLRHANRCPGHG